MHLFGIETEYGITREDLDAVDPVEESMELVRAHLTGDFEPRWDYGVKIRMRMRGDSVCPACSKTKKRTISPRSTRIDRFRFTR